MGGGRRRGRTREAERGENKIVLPSYPAAKYSSNQDGIKEARVTPSLKSLPCFCGPA